MKNIAPKRVPATLNPTQPLQRKVLAAVVAACFISAAQANPSAPQVVAGQASFNQQGNLFSITNTPNTIINWQSFSIGANDITRFIQQSSDSKVLNRITGQDPSQILGALQSNGKVFLINPNGVMFGAGSRVDVNGLVASSLNISDADFLAGKNNFVGSAGAGKVSNQGTITTPGGGQVFLIAPNVDNSGIITSPNGEIILAAGASVQLVDSSNPDVQVQISAPTNQALNLGQIVAQGGRVGIYGALINQRGHISADSAVLGDAGQIMLKASGTTLLEAGSTTTATAANGSGGKGGSIELLGQQVGLTGNAKVDASGAAGGGTVLVGGDYHGQNPAVQNAQSSYVGADAVIAADAVQTGQGGKVIVWSDQATRAFGSISARGGAQGGDGGFVETSGAYLDVAGIKVSTAAAHGKLGQWLLDPDDIVVDNSGAATLDGDITFGGSGTSTIAPSAFDGSTSSVVLQANNSISFNSPVAMTVAAAELTARAGGNISVNSTISTNNGAVTLTANYTLPYPLLATGTGAMHVSSGGAINTNSSGGGGAAISLSGATVTIEDQLNAGSGLIALSANGGSSPSAGNIVVAAGSTSDLVTLPSGTITLVASNDITLNAPVNLSNQSGTAFDAYAGNNITLAAGSGITTAGGGVSLQANDGTYSAASGTGVLAVNPNSGGISTNGGNVLMSGASLMLEDNVNTGTGNLQLYATDGDITLNGALTADTANLTATHDIIFNSSVNVTHVPELVTGPDQPPPTFNAHAGNTITLTATGSITTAGGDVELSGTNFQLAGNTNTGVGTLNVQSDVAGGAITIASTSTLAGNAVNLVADSMQLGGHINTGNDVWIGSYSPNATINLGASATNSGADGVYVLGLTDTELNTISTHQLLIGDVLDTYTGTVNVNDALNLTGITGLSLMGGNVGIHAALSGPNSINLQSLVAGGAINIDSSATLSASNNYLRADSMALNGHINSPTGSVTISTLSPNYGINLGADAISSAAVTASCGVLGKPGVLGLTDTALGNINAPFVQISTAGALGVTGALNLVGGTAATNSLRLAGGSIAVNAPLSANQNVNLSSSGGNIAINASLSATQNAYLSSGGNITENSNGLITAPSLSFAGATWVNLGGANNVSYLAGRASEGDLLFTNGGTGTLHLSNVDGASGLQAQSHTLTLTSGGDISQDAYGYLVASKVVLNTPGSVDLTAAGGTNQIGQLEAQNIGSLKLTQTMIPVTLGGGGDGDVNGVTLSTSSISGRSITVSDGYGITVAQPVDGNGAPVTLFGGTGGITVNAALSASTLGLTADHMSFSAPLTAQLASFTNASANLPIHVGDAGGSCSPYLALNDLSQVSADAISIGAASGSAVSGAIKVGGFGTVIQPLVYGVPTTSTLTLLTGAGITQTGPIVVPALGVQAGGTVTLTDSGNAINSVAAQLTAGNFNLATTTDLSLVRLTDTLSSSALYDLNGISTPGNVSLNSSGAITRGSTTSGDAGITAHTLTLQAGNGIGADGAPLVTSVLTLSAQNQTGGDGGSSPINIKNTDQDGGAPLMTLTRAWQSADGEGVNSGSITIENTGAMVVSGGDSSGVQTNTGAITLFTHSPLTINGQVGSTSGAIALSAGASGGNNDTLTIANGNLVSTSGPITLAAGGSVNVTTGTVLGNVTRLANQNTPGLSTCIANPSISGCSTVLPSLSSCTSNPGLTGCSVVLPSLASCTNSPGLAGCSVVLPSLSSCTNNPGLAGCSAVLPSLASCTTAPTLDGCVAVLPSLSSCTTNPTLAGCSAVLPSLSSCTTTPALAGCSAVLPSLSSCTTTPTVAGCSAVLPSLSSCTTTPTLAGCSAVLPSLSNCTTTPTLAGCSAVLPSLSSCTTTPTLAGCSAVLPSLSSCTTTPTLGGCSAVLPSLSSCTTTPTLGGCSAVLPSLSSCTTTPTLVGCSAVLPSLSSCTTTPTLVGCSAVLPSLSSCATTPSLAGCSAVLPSLSSCTTTPSLAGCSAVLPSLSSCTSNPTAAGCSAVLPTLSSCTSNPTAAGCSAVLPTLASCTSNPTAAGCSAVLPTLSTCTSNPTAAGCSAVLPTLASCTIN